MTFDELVTLAEKVFPDCIIFEDSDGQICIGTGWKEIGYDVPLMWMEEA